MKRRQDIHQASAAIRTALHANARTGRGPKYLFSGLLTCGQCGHKFVILDPTRYGCSGWKYRGLSVCTNTTMAPRKLVEGLLLDAIQRDLFTEEGQVLFKQETAKLLATYRRGLNLITRRHPPSAGGGAGDRTHHARDQGGHSHIARKVHSNGLKPNAPRCSIRSRGNTRMSRRWRPFSRTRSGSLQDANRRSCECDVAPGRSGARSAAGAVRKRDRPAPLLRRPGALFNSGGSWRLCGITAAGGGAK